MASAKVGDTVSVHYTGKLADGTIFDSSVDREPLEFELGQGRVIPGFENSIIGLNKGDTTKVSIPPDEAYGAYNTNLVVEVDRAKMPGDIELKIGVMLESVQNDGRRIPMTIIKLTDDMVTLDANHPLAGKELHFEIELVEIKAQA